MTTTPSGDAEPGSRRAIWITIGAIVLVAIIVVVIFLLGGGAGGVGHTGVARQTTSLSTKSAYATPATPGVTTGPHQTSGGQTPPSSAPQVSYSATATATTGVAVTVTDLAAVAGKAKGSGEVSGPAVQFQVNVKNPTSAAVPLSNAVVTLYYGSDQTPGVQLTGNSTFKALPTSVAPGATATGTYIFSAPVDQRSVTQVTFDYNAGSPQLVFQGAAPTS